MNSMKSRINKSLIGMGVVTMVITAVICLFSLSGAYIHHVQMDMEAVSYTHLDVYKRQALYWSMMEGILSIALRKLRAAANGSAIARCPLL